MVQIPPYCLLHGRNRNKSKRNKIEIEQTKIFTRETFKHFDNQSTNEMKMKKNVRQNNGILHMRLSYKIVVNYFSNRLTKRIHSN